MKVLTIIQARMLSSRLPGKVMKTVLGKPLIGYMLERLARCQAMDKIVLATSVDPSNDPLCAYVQSLGYEVFRGAEEDVLERYYMAARQYRPGAVVRMTGDCPLADPRLCDRLIKAFFEQKADQAYLHSSFAEGLDCEIFTYDVLEKMYREADLQSEREHVSQYIANHKDVFKIYKLMNEQDHSRYRIVVDEPEDFEVVKAIIEHFCRKPGGMNARRSWRGIAKLSAMRGC